MQKRDVVPVLFALLFGVFISDANSTTITFNNKSDWLSNLPGAYFEEKAIKHQITECK